jgi:hypothetical protein
VSAEGERQVVTVTEAPTERTTLEGASRAPPPRPIGEANLIDWQGRLRPWVVFPLGVVFAAAAIAGAFIRLPYPAVGLFVFAFLALTNAALGRDPPLAELTRFAATWRGSARPRGQE